MRSGDSFQRGTDAALGMQRCCGLMVRFLPADAGVVRQPISPDPPVGPTTLRRVLRAQACPGARAALRCPAPHARCRAMDAADGRPPRASAAAAAQPMDLESAIAAQTKDTPAEQVTELVLDTCKATKVVGLEKFSNLKSLTLNGCGLTTLEGFPTLPELRKLELSDNNISEGLEMLQDAALFQLKSLSLAGNKFSTLEDLEPLVSHPLARPGRPRLHCSLLGERAGWPSAPKRRGACGSQSSLPNLRDLDLFNCAVTDVENYRQGLFDMLPNLKYLDGFDACARSQHPPLARSSAMESRPGALCALPATRADVVLPARVTKLRVTRPRVERRDDNEKEEEDDEESEADIEDDDDDLLDSEGALRESAKRTQPSNATRRAREGRERLGCARREPLDALLACSDTCPRFAFHFFGLTPPTPRRRPRRGGQRVRRGGRRLW